MSGHQGGPAGLASVSAEPPNDIVCHPDPGFEGIPAGQGDGQHLDNAVPGGAAVAGQANDLSQADASRIWPRFKGGGFTGFSVVAE